MIDPVMVAESGAVLLDDEARAALVERLLPLATVVTPNIPEARVLTGLGEEASQEELARAVLALGPEGGGRHRRPQRARWSTSSSTASESVEIPGERHPGRRRARLRLHPLLGAGRLPGPRRRRRWRRPAGPARSPPRRSAPACARSARGPGPVDVFGPRSRSRLALSRFRP